MSREPRRATEGGGPVCHAGHRHAGVGRVASPLPAGRGRCHGVRCRRGCDRTVRGHRERRRTRHRPGAAHPGDARPAGRRLPPPGPALDRGRHRRRPPSTTSKARPASPSSAAWWSARTARPARHACSRTCRTTCASCKASSAAGTVTNGRPRSASYELTSTSLPVRGARRSTTSTPASPEPVSSGPSSCRATLSASTGLTVGDVRGPRPGAEGLHRPGERAVRRDTTDDRDGCRSRSQWTARGPCVRPSTTLRSSTGPWSEAALAQMEWSARTAEFELPLRAAWPPRRPTSPSSARRATAPTTEPRTQPDRGCSRTRGPAIATYSKQSSRTSATLSWVTSVGGTTTSDGTSGSTRSAKPRPWAIRRAMLTAEPAMVGL